MEFCEYGDLERYFNSRHFPRQQPSVKVDLMIQTMKGISFLHGENIVHRDIKPGNILIQKKNNGDPVVKLDDFGLSKFLDPMDETSRMSSNVGTLQFQAPEFWDDQKRYHRNVDVFAAGLTFLSMLQFSTGGPLMPKIARSLDFLSECSCPIGLIMKQRIISTSPKPAVTLVTFNDTDDVQTFSLKELIERMTCVNPSRRPSSLKVLDTLQHLVSMKVNQAS